MHFVWLDGENDSVAECNEKIDGKFNFQRGIIQMN